LVWFLIFGVSYFYNLPGDPGRVYLIGLLFFSYLAIFPLWKLIDFNFRNKFRHVAKFMLPLLLIFLFLNLPINLSLQTQENILHYHVDTDVSILARVRYYETNMPDFVFAEWIERYVSPNSYVSLDFRGFIDTYLANHLNRTFASTPSFAFGTSFLTVSRDYFEYGIWSTRWEVINATETTSENMLQDSLVYNDGQMMLFFEPQG
jgi:hypothetical protein